MKRAREADEPETAENRLFLLPCDLAVHVGQFLVLCDLHAYVCCLFLHYGITRHGEAIYDVEWDENQLILLDGFQALLHAKNTLHWPGWLQAKTNLIRVHLHDASLPNKTLAQVEQHYALARHVDQCRHFEVLRFARDTLCERCCARQSLYRDPRLCSPCRHGMDQRIYKKALPTDGGGADAYSWIGRALLRRLCGLKRNGDVDEYARTHGIRNSGHFSSTNRLFLLKDVLPLKRAK